MIPNPVIDIERKSVAVLVRMPPTIAEIVASRANFSGCSKPEAVRRIIEMFAKSLEQKRA